MNSSNSFAGSGSNHHKFSGTHYVVSEDVDILINRWCKEVNLIPPNEVIFAVSRAKMRDALEEIFHRVTFIDGKEIREGLLESVAKYKAAGLSVVTLERAYLEDDEVDGRIELTRVVDGDGGKIKIPFPRHGAATREAQFNRLRGKEIALIDDVVFTGDTLINTISDLHHKRVSVHAVTAAVGVTKGVEKLKSQGFHVLGQPEHMIVDCIEEFNQLADQICERDFYPGVPYSGREHFGVENLSFPYVLPFGRMLEWATIGDRVDKQFSVLCLDNTIAIFEEIEKTNNIRLSCSDVPRPVFGSPMDGTRFVDFLEASKESLLKV